MIVVDEQGNEYEATYPKRARGLVKCGRARFIDENKICLACPPNIILEDKMTDNKTTENVELAKAAADKAKKYTAAFEAEYSNEADAVTIKELLQKISELQNQLSDPLSSMGMGQLTGAIGAIVGEEDDDDMDVRLKQIPEICDAFKAREQIFLKILDAYVRIYDSLTKISYALRALRM